jgi:membrane fusion protein, multidrug efflux system
MTSRYAVFWRCSLLLLLAGCGSNAPPVADTPPPPVTVSQPVVRNVTDYDFYIGHVAAVETVEVRARVRGYLDKVNFTDGQVVKLGQLLFEIDPRPYKTTLEAAEAQLAAARAALELARSEYARSSILAETKAVSQSELETWKAKEGVATGEKLKAQAAVDQAQLDLGFTKIHAPIGGRTSRTQVTAGNLVNAGGGETLLTTIVTVDPVYVYFDVDERALLQYREQFRKGQKQPGPEPSLKDLKIPIHVGLEGEQGYPHEGLIDFADNRVNASTGTIQVRGVLPNPKRVLDSGMLARVRVPVGDPHKAILITERAVGTDQGRKFVYVVTDQSVAERRDIDLGRLSEGMQVVTDGLKPEDWIVVNGIQRVRDGARVEPKRSSMPGAPSDKANLVSMK